MPVEYEISKKSQIGEVLPQKSLGLTIYNKLRNRDPNKVILIKNETNYEVTNGEFLRTTIKISCQMRKLGVGRNDVVTIVSNNCWEYLATTSACFFVGATAVLLNFDYTSGELEHIFSTCPPKLVFCSKSSLHNVLNAEKKKEITVILFNNDEKEKSFGDIRTFNDLVQSEKSENFNLVEVDLKEDVAVIITSSGTTGLPKAVMITHFNLLVPLSCINDKNCVCFNENVRTIDYLPFFHIMGMCWALSALIYNTKAVVIKKFRPDVFLTAIYKYKITTLLAVPAVLIFLAKKSIVQNFDISSLEVIFSSGASLKKEVEDTLKSCFSNVVLRQAYGMTEVSGPVTCTLPGNVKKGCVGQPLRSNEIIVVGEDETVLGPNQTGELRIKSNGLMKGYCQNKSATISAYDKNGYLKSGDLGYFDEDNDFFIVGRLKEIIKYKGFQVPPAELESLLIKHEAIADAGVIGVPDERAGELPLAFVVKAEEHSLITEEEIIRYVEDNVSMQKRLYGGVRFVQEIPKTPSGKIIRKKLVELL